MKNWFYLILISVFGLNAVSGAEAEQATYCVQLIRGNNRDTPPVADAKPVSPELTKMIRRVFNWKSYWEINRQRVTLARGQKAKVRLSKEREVEIDLTDLAKRKVTAYEGRKAVTRSTWPVGNATTIIGGDRDSNSVWFIVVRRSQPREKAILSNQAANR